MIHKPVGVVSAQPDPGQVPAVRLLTPRAQWGGPAATVPDLDGGLAPLGRLDMDSRGLLLLSQDGVLAKAVIGPQSLLDKEYEVRVSGRIDQGKLALLRHGLELDGRKLKPAKVRRTGDQTLDIVLTEGRNRQIRRMCELVGLKVEDLFRVRIGPLSLGDLPEGRWRPLTAQERDALIKGSQGRADPTRVSTCRRPRGTRAAIRPRRRTTAMPSSRFLFAPLLIGAVLVWSGPAAADLWPPPWAKPRHHRKLVAPAGPAADFRIRGFRSAVFGMDRGQVLAAIAKDFQVPADQVRTAVTPLDRTTVLTATVPALEPGPGPAKVSYVLGGQPQAGAGGGDLETAEPSERAALINDGRILVNYFKAQTWEKDATEDRAPLEAGGCPCSQARTRTARRWRWPCRGPRARPRRRRP